MPKPNGAVIFKGASRIDGAPIVVIVTGLARPSENDKTGNMLQTWILRSDIGPIEAVNTGADSSICGGCPHRGTTSRKRSCYVQVGQAPRSIFEAFERGNYPEVFEAREIAKLGNGRAVRLGAYGDPAAAPVAIWEALTSYTTSHTGYTHQWKSGKLAGADLMGLCQASVDSPKELEAARAKGFGTFRVAKLSESLDSLETGEVVCPATTVGLTCADCGLCKGYTAVNVVILAHGAGAQNAEAI